jgi:hypothetical protein
MVEVQEPQALGRAVEAHLVQAGGGEDQIAIALNG